MIQWLSNKGLEKVGLGLPGTSLGGTEQGFLQPESGWPNLRAEVWTPSLTRNSEMSCPTDTQTDSRQNKLDIYFFYISFIYTLSPFMGLSVHVWYCLYNIVGRDLTWWMSRVPVNTLHFVPLPWEMWVKRLCVSGHLVYIVWAFSVLVLPVD
jgi:hypothetical protein